MKSLFVLFLFALSIISSNAQLQYVGNPSFEEYQFNYLKSGVLMPAPTEYNIQAYLDEYDQFVTRLGNYYQIYHPISWETKNKCNGWYEPNLGSTDYFRTNSPTIPVRTSVFIPNNYIGVQYAVPGIYGSNAYAGFWVQRKFSSTTLPLVEYREYLQTKLMNPLLKGAKYHVSFKISLADNLAEVTPHTTNSIGVLFTTEAIERNDARPIIAFPQIKSSPDNWLANTGGPTNTEWMTIEGDITVPENLTDPEGYKYLTIGNFDFILNYRNVNPPPEENLQTKIYYYIDDVNITLVDQQPCWCGKDAIEARIHPNPTQTSETECCYNIEIDIKNLTRACPIYGFKIYNKNNPNQIFVNSTNPSAYIKGSTVLFNNICINKNIAGEKASFMVQSLDENGNPVGDCPPIELSELCKCECSKIQQMHEDVLLTFEFVGRDEDNNCCYQILAYNSSNCFVRIDQVFLNCTIDDHTRYNDVIIEDNPDDYWTGSVVTENNYLYAWTNSTSDYIKPNTKVILGSICIPQNNNEYFLGLDWRINGNVCADFTRILKCEEVVNCCDHITAELVNDYNPDFYAAKSATNACCWYLKIKQDNPTACSVIDNYEILKLVNGFYQLVDSDYYAYNANGTLIGGQFCIEVPEGQTGSLNYRVVLYHFGSTMCIKDVSATCSHAPGSGGANEVIETEKISNDVKLNVNAESTELEVEISDNNLKLSSVYITDYLGNVIYSKDIIHEQSNQFKVDCSSLSSGIYFCNIIANSGVITKKFLIIK